MHLGRAPRQHHRGHADRASAASPRASAARRPGRPGRTGLPQRPADCRARQARWNSWASDTEELDELPRRLISASDAERSRLERAIARQVVPHLQPLPDRLRRAAVAPDRRRPRLGHHARPARRFAEHRARVAPRDHPRRVPGPARPIRPSHCRRLPAHAHREAPTVWWSRTRPAAGVSIRASRRRRTSASPRRCATWATRSSSSLSVEDERLRVVVTGTTTGRFRSATSVTASKPPAGPCRCTSRAAGSRSTHGCRSFAAALPQLPRPHEAEPVRTPTW